MTTSRVCIHARENAAWWFRRCICCFGVRWRWLRCAPARSSSRSSRSLVLRHELAVLHCLVARPQPEKRDRVLLGRSKSAVQRGKSIAVLHSPGDAFFTGAGGSSGNGGHTPSSHGNGPRARVPTKARATSGLSASSQASTSESQRQRSPRLCVRRVFPWPTLVLG